MAPTRAPPGKSEKKAVAFIGHGKARPCAQQNGAVEAQIDHSPFSRRSSLQTAQNNRRSACHKEARSMVRSKFGHGLISQSAWSFTTHDSRGAKTQSTVHEEHFVRERCRLRQGQGPPALEAKQIFLCPQGAEAPLLKSRLRRDAPPLYALAPQACASPAHTQEEW